jgi:hypothetical protein
MRLSKTRARCRTVAHPKMSRSLAYRHARAVETELWCLCAVLAMLVALMPAEEGGA